MSTGGTRSRAPSTAPERGAEGEVEIRAAGRRGGAARARPLRRRGRRRRSPRSPSRRSPRASPRPRAPRAPRATSRGVMPAPAATATTAAQGCRRGLSRHTSRPRSSQAATRAGTLPGMSVAARVAISSARSGLAVGGTRSRRASAGAQSRRARSTRHAASSPAAALVRSSATPAAGSVPAGTEVRAAPQAISAADMHARPAMQPARTARAACAGTDAGPRWATVRTRVGRATTGSSRIAHETTASYGPARHGLVMRTACTCVVTTQRTPKRASADRAATPARRSALLGASPPVTGSP